jgi:lysozyme
MPVPQRGASKKGVVISGALMAAICGTLVGFTPTWEGMDRVAKRDMIGTGHPVTYCYGQTDEFGDVKVGQRFTKVECDAALQKSLPRYIAGIAKCMTHIPAVTDAAKVIAALADASYNAGIAAVCRSPMLAKINAGDYKAGCDAFVGWYIRSDGKVRKGLIARRSGLPNDVRKSERDLCLEGI